jgi:phosphoglycerate dehydrogenase-like enzyme
MSLIWSMRPLPADLRPLVDGRHEIVVAGGLAELPADAFARVEASIAGSLVPYDTALFQRMPRLRVVSRVGIGFDNIVVPDATRAGVAVCNTPDGPTAPTAEIAVMLMIAASRFATRADRLMRARRPDQGTEIFAPLEGMQLRGRTLGLVGFGRIGRAVAAAAKALGMEVVAYDPVAKPEDAAKLGVKLVASVDEALRAGDVVSLHVPASPETRRMIDARALGLMKKGAVLVNAARGALVDEAALADALKSGHLLGAGLDVFEKEPVDPKHPLLGLDNVVALPHVGGGTVTSRAAMWKGAVENAVAVLAGQRPAYLVNPDVWPRCIAAR